ncbi:TolB family protein [Ilumatobacter sp.]|uniref:TolB family protein n=1 Tax=Ilumatobacter sp. TaxID=1967498 RepID=UPI003AF9ABF7
MTDRANDAASEPEAPTSFHRLADFVAVPRLAGLALSPNGDQLVTSVATLDADGTKWQTALWAIDPAGGAPARRLTRSAPGESSPVFAPDGSLLFTSKRVDPDAGTTAAGADDDPKPALWSLPPDGGEARLVTSHPAGIGTVAVAGDSGDVAIVASMAVGAADPESDTARRGARKRAGVTAVLHESYPVRYWDHDLGESVPHAFWLGVIPHDRTDSSSWRDLTPDAAVPHGVGESVSLSPSGALMAHAEQIERGSTGWRSRLVVTDTGTGERRVLIDDASTSVESPRFSPDSTRIVCVLESTSSYDDPPDQTLVVVDLDTGEVRDLTPGFDRWPTAPQFDAVGEAVYFLADDDGRHPVFRVVPGGSPVRLTGDGAYTDLQVARDGSALYALRSAIDAPAAPVRLDPSAPRQDPEPLPNPGTIETLPGRLREIDATAADGSRVQS